MTSLVPRGVVAQIRFGDEFALSHLSSGYGFDLDPAEGREGVHDCDADVNFGGLAVRVSWHDPFPEALEAVHPGLDPAADMVSRPRLPERPAQVPGCVEDLVSRNGRGAVSLPGTTVTADRYDAVRTSFDDRLMATSRIIGAVGGDGIDRFVGRDLGQQLWQ